MWQLHYSNNFSKKKKKKKNDFYGFEDVLRLIHRFYKKKRVALRHLLDTINHSQQKPKKVS